MEPEITYEANEEEEIADRALENEAQPDEINGSSFVDTLLQEGEEDDDPGAILNHEELKITLKDLFVRVETTQAQLQDQMIEMETMLLI
jgi:hypothetical protein